MSLTKWNGRKTQGVKGGGLLSSNPPQLQSQSNSIIISSDDEDDFGLVASTEASTSINPMGSILSRNFREDSVDSNMIDDPDVEISSAPTQPKKRSPAKGKGKGPIKKKKTTKESEFVSNIPWPEHFVKLEKTFKALNTIYTFLSARRSVATTYDTLKGGVENLLKRPLEVHDIAQIKALLPQLISFAYIDSELLRVNPAGGGTEASQRKGKKAQDLDLAYEAAAALPPSSPEKGEETVLLFSFNDGELKSSNGVGKVISRKFQNRKKKSVTADEEKSNVVEKVPKFTTESMTTLIAKRNGKFSSAVHELLAACAVNTPPHDPVELLLEATEENLPARPNLDELEGKKGLGELKEDFEFYRKNPDKRPSIARIIEEFKDDEEYRDQIVDGGHKIMDSREAIYGELETNLSTSLWDALYATKSITQLFSHQALAINHLANHQSVIVSTSTSSGKSLIYQIPVLKSLEEDSGSTALYIFPTKALAQDQKRALGEILANFEGLEDIKIATFDGDTPKDDREYIRENVNVIFTNPDMLHITILPREESWRRFFRNLKFVVVDELHSYAGLFGCHVSFVMRRLRRVCHAVGNHDVLFISCSATISNPAEHMETIFGIENVVVVDIDGSPSGRKEYLVWNPPRIDDNDWKQGRVSSITETSRIFRSLLDRGIRAIVFCKVRQQCEILMKQVRADLMVEGRSDLVSRIMSYRSGYSAADRRQIEQQMFSGELVGIISTTALELGVDIGSLDAVITVGFPYTLAGWRQQSGRAGRRNKDSMSMLICDPFPLDQHYARNPEEIFSSSFTKLSLDLTNPIVLEAHIQCAAFEVPIHPEEDQLYFGETLPQICLNKLVKDSEGFYHSHPRYLPAPARTVPIRNTEDEVYHIIDISNGRNVVLEEIEFSRAIFTIYSGAIFLHMGRSHLVKEVDHDRKIAKVQAATVQYQTKQRDFTNVDALEVLAIRKIAGSDCVASYGTVQITSIVFGYFKTDRRNNILDTVDISSPPFIRTSHGFWLDVPKSALQILILKNIHPAGSIHAAEHALMSLTPLVASSIDGDVKTECKQPEKELANTPSSRKRPARLILYDSAGKSGGICAKAFDHISILLTQAADTIKNCKCLEGCPSCVASHICSGANAIVSKIGALVVLESILGREIDIDSIPMQESVEGSVPGGSIDLAGAGIKMNTKGAGIITKGLMEEEEMGEAERIEREAALAELMGL